MTRDSYRSEYLAVVSISTISVVMHRSEPTLYGGMRMQWYTHAPYVCGFAGIDMVHGCMVYTERADMAAVSCGTSHASAVSIFKNAL